MYQSLFHILAHLFSCSLDLYYEILAFCFSKMILLLILLSYLHSSSTSTTDNPPLCLSQIRIRKWCAENETPEIEARNAPNGRRRCYTFHFPHNTKLRDDKSIYCIIKLQLSLSKLQTEASRRLSLLAATRRGTKKYRIYCKKKERRGKNSLTPLKKRSVRKQQCSIGFERWFWEMEAQRQKKCCVQKNAEWGRCV